MKAAMYVRFDSVKLPSAFLKKLCYGKIQEKRDLFFSIVDGIITNTKSTYKEVKPPQKYQNNFYKRQIHIGRTSL